MLMVVPVVSGIKAGESMLKKIQALFKGKKEEPGFYDKSMQYPVIRASICSGEKVFGFKDLNTGRFHEVGLLKSEEDLDYYRDLYKIYGDIPTVY